MIMNKKKTAISIFHLFENVYPVRHQIMFYTTATSLSTFCYATGIQLTDKEKEEFLKPIRDIPVQQEWIKSEIEKGTRISIVGKDVPAWLTRIKNPKEYWTIFRHNPILRIWIITRRGIEEMDEIHTRIMSIHAGIAGLTLMDENLIEEAHRAIDLRKDLTACRKMINSDPMPSGTFINAEAYAFMYQDHDAGRESTNMSWYWRICRDMVDNKIEVFYRNTEAQMNLFTAICSSLIVDRIVPEAGMGCISLSKDVSKFEYIIPSVVMRGVTILPEFDIAFPVTYRTKSGETSSRHIVIRVGR
jgi:hypothetical protein